MTYKRVLPLLFLRLTILQFLSRCLADFNEQRTFMVFPFFIFIYLYKFFLISVAQMWVSSDGEYDQETCHNHAHKSEVLPFLLASPSKLS